MKCVVELDLGYGKMPEIRQVVTRPSIEKAVDFLRKRAVVKSGQMFDVLISWKIFKDKDTEAVKKAYHDRHPAEEMPEVIITDTCIYVLNVEDSGFLLQIMDADQ